MLSGAARSEATRGALEASLPCHDLRAGGRSFQLQSAVFIMNFTKSLSASAGMLELIIGPVRRR